MAIDTKYGAIEIPGIPPGEPVFVIRGKDLSAVGAIREYAINADAGGASPEFTQSVMRRADEFQEWQKANPDVVKMPD